MIGREREVERIIEILSRRTKNNPILLGERSGKTAIVEGLAERIVEGEVPIFLASKRIVALDLSLIVAGTKSIAASSRSASRASSRSSKDNKRLIVFIGEIHSLIGAGSAEGLARRGQHPQAGALAAAEISCVGATTLKEYRKYIEKDRSLLRRFQSIRSSLRRPSRPCRFSKGSATATRPSTGALHRGRPAHGDLSVGALSPTASSPTRPSAVIDEAGARSSCGECATRRICGAWSRRSGRWSRR